MRVLLRRFEDPQGHYADLDASELVIDRVGEGDTITVNEELYVLTLRNAQECRCEECTSETVVQEDEETRD